MRTVWRKAEHIGSMNRLIRLEIPLYTRDAYGGMNLFWIRSREVWAEYRQDTTGSEGEQVGRMVTKNKISFRLHYLDVLSHFMRLMYKGSWYDVLELFEDELNQFVIIEAERRDESFNWTRPDSITEALDPGNNTWKINTNATRTGIYFQDALGNIWENVSDDYIIDPSDDWVTDPGRDGIIANE